MENNPVNRFEFDAMMNLPGFDWKKSGDPDYAPESRSHEFITSHDGGDTELEYLGLLHWLVRSLKPSNVIETGTANGLGSIAIASALRCNGGGMLWTVDVGDCEHARRNIDAAGLGSFVTQVKCDSLKFCATTDWSFDFGFFDSNIDIRFPEIEMLVARKKLSGFAAIHDTGKYSFGNGLNHQLRCDIQSFEGISLPLGRGLSILKLPNQ